MLLREGTQSLDYFVDNCGIEIEGNGPDDFDFGLPAVDHICVEGVVFGRYF